MPENATVFTLTQLGAEGTAGTRGVPGTVLPALAYELNVDATFMEFMPMGHKYTTEVAIGKEWSTFDIEGYGCFNCIVYPLAGVMGTATITAGSITQWSFTPNDTTVDSEKTFTIQNGSSVRAVDATYGRVTNFTYHVDREKIEIGGGGFAQRLTEGTTLQGSAKTVALVPMLPAGFDFYADITSGGIGGTKLNRVLSIDYETGDKANPLWVVNSANNSFVADVELKPTKTLKVVVEHDTANGGTLMYYMRAGTRLFARVSGTGDVIQGGTAYTFRHDMALEVLDAPAFGDQDGVRTMEFTYAVVYDSGWGKAENFTVFNLQTGL
jgi:hypothetical protein